MKHIAPVACLALGLAACSAPTVPDVTYYRLAEPAAAVWQRAPSFPVPVDVAVFGADGLYAEQALIYSTDAGGTLRTYHYQLWADPPARLLQRRLIDVLRRAQAAPLVTDRLPASADALRITGLIRRFDRARRADGFHAEIDLQLRVERSGRLLAEPVYHADMLAQGTDLEASVAAFGRALDDVYARFLADLAALDVGISR